MKCTQCGKEYFNNELFCNDCGGPVKADNAFRSPNMDLNSEINGGANPVAPNPPPGYNAAPPGYNAAPPGYNAAPPGYNAAPPGYNAAPPGYNAAPPGYNAAPPGYNAAPPGYNAAPPGYNAAPPGYNAAPPYGQVKTGIGGWLLIFIVIITIVRPLMTVNGVFQDIKAIDIFSGEYPGFTIVMIIDIVLGVVVAILGVIVGINLQRLKRGSVEEAKKYIILVGVYSLVISVIPYFSGLPSLVLSALIPTSVGQAIGSIGFFVIWYNYFIKSKRVKATYAPTENSFTPTENIGY